jgi:sporulation protein YlmC with PRC-barrel domain
MRLRKLLLAASVFLASGISSAAVEMIKPFEVLEEARRARLEFDKRQVREKAERQKQEKEREAKRKHEEAKQREQAREEKAQQAAQRKHEEAKRREQAKEEKAQQAAQRKRDAEVAKSAQNVRPPAAPALVNEPSEPALRAPVPPTQATEHQTVQNAAPARPLDAQPPPAPPPTPPVRGHADGRQPQARSEPGEAGIGRGGQSGREEGVSRGNSPAAGASAALDGAAAARPEAGGHAVAVSRLKRMNVYNERGDKLGEVEQVVQSEDGSFHVVVGAGGFLGIRERDVRFPIEQVTIRGDKLTIQGVTGDQVRAMPLFDHGDRTYRELTHSTTVLIVRDQSKDRPR